MTKHILHLILIIIYFILGAYATTDVSRLLKGAVTSIYDPNCYCPSCGTKIPLRSQIPVISYLINRGKCSYCHHKITRTDILPEILLPLGFLSFSYILHFSFYAYLVCIGLFEGYKFLCLVYYGARTSGFLKNLVFSLLMNSLLFLLLGFFFFLANVL